MHVAQETTAMTPPRPGAKAAGSRRMTHGMMAGRARNGLRRRQDGDGVIVQQDSIDCLL